MAPKFKLHTGKYYDPVDRHFVVNDGPIKNLYNELTQYVAFSQLAEAELVSMGLTQVIGNHLTISGSVDVDHVLSATGSNTITFTDSAIGNRILPRTASNTFTINQTIGDVEVYRRPSSNTADFSGAAVVHKIATRALTSTLTISQAVVEEVVSGYDFQQELLRRDSIYWKGITHQRINLVIRGDNNVSAYASDDINVNVSLNNQSLFAGLGSMELKENGRFSYLMAAADCEGEDVGIMFASAEGSELKEHYFRPLEPPIQDDFYGSGTVISVRTSLGSLTWDDRGDAWNRDGSAVSSFTGTGKRVLTFNVDTPNVFALQTYFTVPEDDDVHIGIILRGRFDTEGFYFIINTKNGGDSPTLEIIQGYDGDTLIASQELPSGIQGQNVVMRAMVIGTTLSLMLYSNFDGPAFYQLDTVSIEGRQYSSHGLYVNRWNGDGTYHDYSFAYMKFVPYLEG